MKNTQQLFFLKAKVAYIRLLHHTSNYSTLLLTSGCLGGWVDGATGVGNRRLELLSFISMGLCRQVLSAVRWREWGKKTPVWLEGFVDGLVHYNRCSCLRDFFFVGSAESPPKALGHIGRNTSMLSTGWYCRSMLPQKLAVDRQWGSEGVVWGKL